MIKRFLVLMLSFTILMVAGCQTEAETTEATPTVDTVAASRDRGMRTRHMAPVPEEYASLVNTVTPTDESVARGAEIYDTYCQRCHGETGMGEGPDGAGASPAPAAVAHTSQMMTDAYLFWRISEGGYEEPFNSIMIPWKGTLEETQRWDVINFMRAMGNNMMSGRGMGAGMGGGAGRVETDPTQSAAEHDAMLAQGVAEGVITEAEATLFSAVHDIVDRIRTDEELRGPIDYVLDVLVARGDVTREDADAFLDVHTRLEETGLMHQ